MLGGGELARINACFGVYDQEWRYYRGFLGEPFLISDCLVYYDGRILYLCGFPLENPFRELSVSDIEDVVRRFEGHQVEGINVWGRLPVLPQVLSLPHGEAKLLNLVGDEYEEDCGEFIIDLAAFDYGQLPRARKGIRRAERAGLSSAVLTRDYLLAGHIALLRRFMETHSLSHVHAGCYLTIPQLLRDPETRVVESYLHGRLVGFKVIVESGSSAATAICGFYDTVGAIGASDLCMGACIDYLRERDVRRLHLGYAATPSLAAFKEKWGASQQGPSYKEGFYHLTDMARVAFERGEFLWRENLFLRVLNRRHAPAEAS